MILGRKTADPRWDRVELPSLYKVLVRVHGEEEALANYERATKQILAHGQYEQWVAVRNGSQITGYRRINPKDWFTFGLEDGEIHGPFQTKRHALHKLGLKKAKSLGPGQYETPAHYVFTRDRAGALRIDPEELPI